MMSLCKLAVIAAALIAVPLSSFGAKQGTKPAPQSAGTSATKPASTAASAASAKATSDGKQYSGMYTFLQEGEYVQISVEDAGQVTGFVSRFDDAAKQMGTFVDQYFKTGKLDGDKLSFTTNPANNRWFDFKGTVQRGEGKSSDDEAYYVLKGTLTESTTGPDKKVTSRAQDVTFKMFPQEAEAAPKTKN
jgi:hypothetical protein